MRRQAFAGRSQQNTRCQVLRNLAGCPKRQTDSRRDGWGCRRSGKERRKQPRKPMTAITTLLNSIPSNLSRRKRPSGAEREPCAPKNHREALDAKGSFRDGDTNRFWCFEKAIRLPLHPYLDRVPLPERAFGVKGLPAIFRRARFAPGPVGPLNPLDPAEVRGTGLRRCGCRGHWLRGCSRRSFLRGGTPIHPFVNPSAALGSRPGP